MNANAAPGAIDAWAQPANGRARQLRGLAREPWTVDNGCMTPIMKIRRNVVEARFAALAAGLEPQRPLHWA